jgi:GTP pyrophosphokinase
MNKNITIDDLLEKINFSEESKKKIFKAYLIASKLHENQYREDGEEYITHPLNVSYIIAEIGGDEATIIAALLHDTLEDTDFTKEEIEKLFGRDVACIVDGVTKINKIKFLTKQEKNLENRRKLVKATVDDVRVIILKLADRLHNMRTIQFKSKEKQIENAKETLDFFVPFAKELGLVNLEYELINLSNKYLGNEEINFKMSDEHISWDELISSNCFLIDTLKHIDINNTYIPQQIRQLILIKR